MKRTPVVTWMEPVSTDHELEDLEIEQEYEEQKGYLHFIGQHSYYSEEHGVVLNTIVGVVRQTGKNNGQVILIQIDKLTIHIHEI